MVRTFRMVCGAGVFCLVFLCAAGAYAGEFRAEFVSRVGTETFPGKVYCSGKKSRMDLGTVSVITRIDKQVIWMLMPGNNMYMELPLDAHYFLFGADDVPGEVSRDVMDTEVVNGVMTEKQHIVYNLGNKPDAVFSWIPPGSSIPVRTVAVDGSWGIEFGNLEEGGQPDALFEVPPGFQKFSADTVSLPPDGVPAPLSELD